MDHNILVVEDDDDIRNSMIAMLEFEGYKAVPATNGKEALEVLQSLPKPCLILLDMMMPIMDGRKFLELMVQDTALAPIPVIVVSAVADKTDIKGANGFIRKPVDMDAVIRIVKNHCDDCAP